MGKSQPSKAKRTYIRIAGDPELEEKIKALAKQNYRDFGQEARRLLRLVLGLDENEQQQKKKIG